MEERQLNGRKVITTNYEVIDDTNVVEVLNATYPLFVGNVSEIEYLFNYYKGIQPITARTKKIRPEINNKIVENHANAIVQFKTGYLLEKPIQYVARKERVEQKSIEYLNDCMVLENKESKDKKIANEQAICGTAYRLALPNIYFEEGNNSPFKIYEVRPTQCYVVYTTGIGGRAVLGVIVHKRKNVATGKEETILQAYTDRARYDFIVGASTFYNKELHIFGDIPLIEYPYNNERLGAFEIVIPLLNAINMVDSTRVDGVEQFIQALLVFKNIDIDKNGLKELLELGAIKIKDDGTLEANVQYLTQELNQSQVQVLKKDMLDVAYEIAGMPSRATTGGGDTGQAVVYRNGWSEVETRTQETELTFKGCERQFLTLALLYTRILTSARYDIKVADLEIKFTRRNYENTMQKANILNMLLGNDKVAPRVAYVVSGLFQDPESACAEGMAWYEEQQKRKTEQQPTPTPSSEGGNQ